MVALALECRWRAVLPSEFEAIAEFEAASAAAFSFSCCFSRSRASAVAVIGAGTAKTTDETGPMTVAPLASGTLAVDEDEFESRLTPCTPSGSGCALLAAKPPGADEEGDGFGFAAPLMLPPLPALLGLFGSGHAVRAACRVDSGGPACCCSEAEGGGSFGGGASLIGTPTCTESGAGAGTEFDSPAAAADAVPGTEALAGFGGYVP